MRRIRPLRSAHAQPLAAKVPEITLLFWILKLLTTGMGEAMSDFLGSVSVPLAGFIGIFGLWFALRLQLRAREYRAPVYWFAVMMVAIFGTMAADGVHIGASAPDAVTTTLYAMVVAGVFYVWYRREGTLSIHSITTRSREDYYWAAVLATFALGTAAGDLTATSLNLGFFGSVLLFAVVISIPALAWWRGKSEPNRRLLGRLHRHAPARRLLRGLVRQAPPADRPRSRRRHRQRRRPCRVRAVSSPTSPPPSATSRARSSSRHTPTPSIPIHIFSSIPSARAPSSSQARPTVDSVGLDEDRERR